MKLHLSSTYSFKEMEWYYLIPEGLAKMPVPQWHEDENLSHLFILMLHSV